MLIGFKNNDMEDWEKKMNISGLIVTARPEDFDSVEKSLSEIEACEIYESFRDEGKFIIVVEEENTDKEVKKFKEMHNIPGVLSVTVAYHHFEDEAEQRPSGSASEKLRQSASKYLN